MKNNIPLPLLADYSDEELLQRVYLDNQATSMEVELARRLEHAIDQLAEQPANLEAVLQSKGS